MPSGTCTGTCLLSIWHKTGICGPSLAPLTKCQTDQIEATVIQKRALNIIYIGTYGMPYTNILFLADLTSLTERREQLARKFFDSVEKSRSCLHHLLPPPRDSALLSRLRAPSKSPVSLIEPKNISPSYPTLYIFLSIFHCWLCFVLHSQSYQGSMAWSIECVFS